FERVARIIENRTPIVLRPGLHTILHLVPFNTDQIPQGQFYAAVSVLHKERLLHPLFSPNAFISQRNSDGYLIHTGLHSADHIGSYLQVFRTGALESVNTLPRLEASLSKERILPLDLEARLMMVLPRYFIALQRLGFWPPILVGLTMI